MSVFRWRPGNWAGLAGGLMALLVCPALGAEAEMKLAEGHEGATGYVPLSSKPAEPAGKLPALKSKKPLYAGLPLGDKPGDQVRLVLDESKGPGTGYDTLYVDANRNADLSDDGVIPFRKCLLNEGAYEADPVRVTVRYADGSQRAILVAVTCWSPAQISEEDGYLQYAVIEHLEGAITLGNAKVLVGLYDSGEPNGCFGDFGADRVKLIEEGKGGLADAPAMLLGRVLRYEDRLWELKVEGAGAKLSIKPYGGPVGRFKASFAPSEGFSVRAVILRLSGADGCHFDCRLTGDAGLELPAGSFRVGSSHVGLTDAAGAGWELSVSCAQQLEVAAGQTTTLKLGAPFKVEPVLQKAARPGRAVPVACRITGAAGEVYGSVRQGTPALPVVAVSDAAGKAVAGGKMEYG